jgi:hypothetical protein
MHDRLAQRRYNRIPPKRALRWRVAEMVYDARPDRRNCMPFGWSVFTGEEKEFQVADAIIAEVLAVVGKEPA